MQDLPQTGNYRYIPLSDAITTAKDMLNISDTTEHDIFLYNMAHKAVLNMNPLSLLHIRNDEIVVEEGVAQMPNNCITYLAMRYCREDGTVYGPYMTELNFLTACNCTVSETGDFSGLVTYTDDKFIWANPLNAPAKIKVAYMARKTDEDGNNLPMIRDYMEEAICYYIQHKFVEKFPKKFATWQYQEWKNGWIGSRSAIISGDAQRDYFTKSRSFYNKLHPPLIAF
jgi:hypothetical protein